MMTPSIIVCGDLSACGRRGNEGPSPLRPVAAAAAAFAEFIPIFRGAGSLIHGLRRALQLLQKPAHALANRLHFSLSAQVTGLVAAEYGQHSSERKQTCPTEDGSNPTRNRVNVP